MPRNCCQVSPACVIFAVPLRRSLRSRETCIQAQALPETKDFLVPEEDITGAADPARTARTELDCHHAPPSHRRPRPDATEMPLLQRADPQNPENSRLLTQ